MIRAASRFRTTLPRGIAIVRPSAVHVDQRKEEQPLPQSALLLMVIPLQNYSGRRHFSTDRGSDSFLESGNDGNLSVDETLNKLFEDSQTSSGDAWYAAGEQLVTDWTPTWYNCADQAIVAITKVHELSGLDYGWSIVATTVVLRLALFPLMVQAQQAASRMAHVQPELQLLKLRYEKLGTPSRQEQLQFSSQMKALFARYNVKPLRTIIAPAVQLPMFIGMFFGLKKMPGIFPGELSDAGMFWFTDLTIPDPLYILPLVSAATFLGLIEMGKEQMLMSSPGQQGQFLLNFFRAMALCSLPICVSFEAAMLCYWTTNNVITMGQTALLKAPPVRKYFGIWEPPKPVPGQEPQSLVTSVSNMVKKVQGEAVTDVEKIKQHNQEVEANKASFRMAKAARERRKRGITGTRNS
jgi:YidC/Oxa1 family membrane protein insertase